MKKCLFLLCLSLVPFVVFSSTSTNPIELPSGNYVPVLDTNGNPLHPSWSYRIISTGRGGLGGDVYLGPSPNSSAPCYNGVFRHNSDRAPRGTPVGFIPLFPIPRPPIRPGIIENQDVNILFTIPVVNLCMDYAIWKVGDYDASLGARLLETGGTIGQQNSSWFRIVKSSRLGYNLFYCPGPFVCPSCPVDQCLKVGVVMQDGKRRLALVNDESQALPFSLNVYFQKVVVNYPNENKGLSS